MIDILLVGIIGIGLLIVGVFIGAVMLAGDMERRQNELGEHYAEKNIQEKQSVDHRHWCCQKNSSSFDQKQRNEIA